MDVYENNVELTDNCKIDFESWYTEIYEVDGDVACPFTIFDTLPMIMKYEVYLDFFTNHLDIELSDQENKNTKIILANKTYNETIPLGLKELVDSIITNAFEDEGNSETPYDIEFKKISHNKVSISFALDCDRYGVELENVIYISSRVIGIKEVDTRLSERHEGSGIEDIIDGELSKHIDRFFNETLPLSDKEELYLKCIQYGRSSTPTIPNTKYDANDVEFIKNLENE